MDSYSKIPKLYGTENITTEEVTGKLDMRKAIFGKVYDFFWWDMEITQTSAVTQFPPNEFQEGLSVRGLQLALVE